MQPIIDPPPIRPLSPTLTPTSSAEPPAITPYAQQRGSDSAYQSTSTPPSTPIETSQEPLTSDLSTPLMFELTRTKLERAAQGQMTGRRGGPSLRQIVLLSNVWSGALPQWNEDQARERELALEEDRRRKEDEERWLEGILEEMEILDEGGGYDDDDEAEDRSYVSVSFRDERSVGDSGFLEESKPPSSSELESRNRDLCQSLGSIEEESDNGQPIEVAPTEIEEEVNWTKPASDLLLENLPPLPNSAPNSPPLPPRSPPIALPDQPSRHSILHSTSNIDIGDCSTSSSPPLHPPALTPDSSPPSSGPAANCLASSGDSLDRELDSRFKWMDDLEQTPSKRMGILALDLPYSSRYASSAELDDVAASAAALTPLTFGPVRPPQASTSKPPVSTLSNSLALALIPTPQSDRHWSPRPPRSLSVPATPTRLARSRSPEPPLVQSFQAGIIKSYYDAVDFGTGSGGILRPQPRRRASSTVEMDSWHDDESSEGRKELALILRPRSAPPYRGDDEGSPPWPRSLSPESSPSRREWAHLSEFA